MNYTQIEINGEKVGLKFGMASFRYLSNTKLEGTGNELNEIAIAKILYSGYYNNCIIKDQEPKYNVEDFVDFIEQNIDKTEFVNEIERVIKLWSENEIIKKTTQETKKKTSRGKK